MAEADDGFTIGNANNANMQTPGDGSSPRMQMYVFTNPPFTFHDGDMDSTVVFHEYTHGLSNRLVGGGNLGGGIQTGAMGEGWSDWVAATINNDPVIGAYVTGNAATGIRRVAYNNSPWTYASLCNQGCEVHNDGEILGDRPVGHANEAAAEVRHQFGQGNSRATGRRRHEGHGQHTDLPQWAGRHPGR